jgi:virginiamycin B lyase
LVAKLSGVELENSSGRPVVARSAGVDRHDASAYVLMLPRLAANGYTVIWHTTSRIDGHVRSGSYTFTVLEPDGSAPPVAAAAIGPPAGPAQVPTQVQAATSWTGLVGLFLVVGGALMSVLGGAVHPGTRRLLGWLLTAAGAGTLIGVLDQFAATWAGSGWQGSALATVLGSGIAKWLWLRLAAAASAMLAGYWLAGTARRRTGRSERPAQPVLVVAAVAMVVSYAESGHGAASSRPAAGAFFMGVHVLAASVWIGGAGCLAVIWVTARRYGLDAARRRVLLRRFSLVAGMAVPAVAATGAASALLELGSVSDFVRSEYAITLLAKLAVAAALGAAAVGTVRAHRGGRADGPAGQARLGRRIWLEAGLGLLILVPTATMSVLGPSGPADAAHRTGRELATTSDPADAFTANSTLGTRGLEFSLTPGTSGTNAIRIEVDGNDPAGRLRVQLTRHGAPASAGVRRTGHDHDPQTHTIYQGTVTLPAAGTWTAIVRGPDGASPPITLPLHPAPPTARTTSPSPPHLDAWLAVIAVLGAAGVVIGATRCLRRPHWRRAAFALGGSGGIAALAGITVLSLAIPSAGSAAVASPWGAAARVSRTEASSATTWLVGARDAGLMMPAVAPDGTVWVGEMDTNTLARLSPSRNVVQQFPLPGGYKEIMGVAVDDDNHVWIAAEHAGALGMFDPATGRYHEYAIPGRDPAPLGVAVAANGTVWFTLMNGNAIGSFDPGTARFSEYPIATPHALPYWLAVGPHGTVWFTEFGTGKIGALDPSAGRVREYPLPHGSSPAGIAIAPSGTIWATTTQGLLVELDARSGRMRTFHMPAADAYGVAVTANGTVWYGLASGSVIFSFDPGDATFTRHPVPPASNPWWVTASQNEVWVALSSDGQGGLTAWDGAG